MNGLAPKEMVTINNTSNETAANWILGGNRYQFNLYELETGTTCAGKLLASCKVEASKVSPTIKSKIPGDANGDGKVDLVDFAYWKREYISNVDC